jgi:cytochrome c peroxidase
LNAPQAGDADLAAGAAVFGDHCASCHGGGKWTKSQVIYLNNPTLNKDGNNADAITRDPGLERVGDELISYFDEAVEPGSQGNPLKFLENIGTFDPADPIEIRQNGNPALGARGFNVPSLLGVGSSAPYFHNGAAQTLEEVFVQHGLAGGTIATALDQGQQAALLAFLQSLDASTELLRSETDDFKEPSTTR